jgi:hypothetical protein
MAESQKVWLTILGHVFEYSLQSLQEDFCFRLIISASENKLLQRKFRACRLFNDAVSIGDRTISEWWVVKDFNSSKMQFPQLLN